MTKKQAALLQKYPLTPLNIATTKRFDKCLAHGGHSFSGTTVLRDLGGQGVRRATLAVCDDCGVPIAPIGIGNRNSMRVVA